MYTVTLKKKEEKRILAGHPWVYANEVLKIEGEGTPGSIVKVKSFDDHTIGFGYINHVSKILVRMISKDYCEMNLEFFKDRIQKANERRISLGYENNYRVVFGESDLLPALIVDKYGDYLSIQILSLGMEKRKDIIVEALIELFHPKGIYERSDVKIREKEGLKERKGPIYGTFSPRVEIIENGCKMIVDLENGQKTGYFLDQKENRDRLKYYVKDKSVLDCFCNVGGFSLCAAKHHASYVESVDISQTAIDEVTNHAKMNGFENIIHPVCADVFEQLRKYKKDKKKFDVVILDPPAFTKTVDTVTNAIKGYKDINILGLKLCNTNGYLVTCSCSQHLTVNLFLKMIEESVYESGVRAQLVEFRTQGMDHPTLIGSEEGLYLKVAILRIIK